ncbi:hypothetical protein A2U01_0007207 [Trifolium medium]|uniref:DUF7028 domain-containing protein n=1 Tax=Trifolium medium TaxID=97028 RepID=A0A392MGB0_9FABA|nr:hypothetical protein [Trifolium medium]
MMTDFARYSARDFERLVRWINNHGNPDESSTHEWVEKATENVEISPSINPKLSMAAKRHLVYNFWKLGFDHEENKIFYIPPDQDNIIWSLKEACKINIQEDAILEEEIGPLIKGLANNHVVQEKEQISLQGLIWQEVELGQQSSPTKDERIPQTVSIQYRAI